MICEYTIFSIFDFFIIRIIFKILYIKLFIYNFCQKKFEIKYLKLFYKNI